MNDCITNLFISPLFSKAALITRQKPAAGSAFFHLETERFTGRKFVARPSDSYQTKSPAHNTRKNQVMATPPHSDININHAEKILLDCFTASTLAGDQRGIHDRLARILPPGAYSLCNLIRGTGANTPGQQGNFAPRGQHLRHRRSPYGAQRRANPPIPMAYLSAAERNEFQLLEEEKNQQFLARSLARETKNKIEQAERRLATLARLNLQQAELDAKKTALLRSNRPVQSSLNMPNPLFNTPGPSNALLNSPSPSNEDGRQSRAQRDQELFGPTDTIEDPQGAMQQE